jgi:phosphopantetheine--protein transferase-like protein
MNNISSVGIDILFIPEFENKYKRLGILFLHRIFSQNEIIDANENISSLAGKFACKEAFIKTLKKQKYSLKDIQVLKTKGRPYILFNRIIYSNVSISHSYNYATAIVINNHKF